MGCKKCGECCKYVAIVVEPMDEDASRWAAYHNIFIAENCGKRVAFIPNRCEKLKEDNTCSIYDQRPLCCVTTPSSQCREFQPPNCKYFEEI